MQLSVEKASLALAAVSSEHESFAHHFALQIAPVDSQIIENERLIQSKRHLSPHSLINVAVRPFEPSQAVHHACEMRNRCQTIRKHNQCIPKPCLLSTITSLEVACVLVSVAPEEEAPALSAPAHEVSLEAIAGLEEQVHAVAVLQVVLPLAVVLVLEVLLAAGREVLRERQRPAKAPHAAATAANPVEGHETLFVISVIIVNNSLYLSCPAAMAHLIYAFSGDDLLAEQQGLLAIDAALQRLRLGEKDSHIVLALAARLPQRGRGECVCAVSLLVLVAVPAIHEGVQGATSSLSWHVRSKKRHERTWTAPKPSKQRTINNKQ